MSTVGQSHKGTFVCVYQIRRGPVKLHQRREQQWVDTVMHEGFYGVMPGGTADVAALGA